jgi:hypothetical protein
MGESIPIEEAANGAKNGGAGLTEILSRGGPVPEVAAGVIETGHFPIPIPPENGAPTKGPTAPEWDQRAWTPKDFKRNYNVGLHNVNIASIDRDCEESYALRDKFLPRTFRTGRASKPESHSHYRLKDGEPPFLQLKDGQMMVELRYGRGKQTVIPPSVHPSGEPYVVGNAAPVAEITAAELERGVRLEAAACLIARHYAPLGGQYDFGMSLAGYLLRHGVSEEDVYALMLAAKELQPEGMDEDAEKNIRRVVETTADALARGDKDVTGGRRLMEEGYKDLVAKLPRILGWEDARGDGPLTEEERKALAAMAWPVCKDLALRDDITSDFAHTLHAKGVAGESNQIRLLYLGVNSRRLKKPVNVAVKGASSSGKSYLVEQVLGGFPDSAYYALSAMSEKALIYLDEDMRHRFLVIYEASGMAGDMQTYLIRTLLSEGKIRYQTAESPAKGVKPRLLEMEGPTGLIVTTTQTKMHPENETRLFSLLVTDSREQTADILMAMADEDREPVSMDEWRALQTWLEGQTAQVYIPYAKELASLIPPVAVRLRRDFMAVLQLIRSHAVLHQATRETDERGRIVASFKDYAVVRELIAPLVAEGVDAGVPATVRETVEMVKEMTKGAKSQVSLSELASALELDKSATSRRWQQARDSGYLKNLEDKKGKPARICAGDPLPEAVEILPTLEALVDRCSVAGESGGRYTPPDRCAVEDGGSGTATSDINNIAHSENSAKSAENGHGDAAGVYLPPNNGATLQHPDPMRPLSADLKPGETATLEELKARREHPERGHIYALDVIAGYRAQQRGENDETGSVDLEDVLDAETNEEEDLLFRNHVRGGRLLELIDARIIDYKEANTLFYNHPDQYEELTSWGQAALQAWIAENIEPDEGASSADPYLLGSYGLKPLFETSERGFYIDNGQMKGAMLAAGYEPVVVDPFPTFNWQFRVRFKKTEDELDELCWVLLADLYEREERPVPTSDWRDLAKTRHGVSAEAFSVVSDCLVEVDHAFQIDAGWIPVYG